MKFSYQGPKEKLQDFILVLYSTCMPTLGLTRRAGQDIERFSTPGGRLTKENTAELNCEYLIPIRQPQTPVA